LELARGGGSCVKDDVDEDGEPCYVLETFDNNARGSAMGYREAQNRVGNVNQGQARPGQARTMKCYNCNGTGHIARNCTQPKRPQNSKYFKDKMLLMQAQENGVALDAEQLLFLAGGPDNCYTNNMDIQIHQIHEITK
nr:hypothetical protein [Tanacetum cinerariifolium]